MASKIKSHELKNYIAKPKIILPKTMDIITLQTSNKIQLQKL